MAIYLTSNSDDLDLLPAGEDIVSFDVAMGDRIHVAMVDKSGNMKYVNNNNGVIEDVPFTYPVGFRPDRNTAGLLPSISEDSHGEPLFGVAGLDPRAFESGNPEYTSPYLMKRSDLLVWSPLARNDISVPGVDATKVKSLTDSLDKSRIVVESRTGVSLYHIEKYKTEYVTTLPGFHLINAFHYGDDIVVVAYKKGLDYPRQMVEMDAFGGDSYEIWMDAPFIFVLRESEDYEIFRSFSSSKESPFRSVSISYGHDRYNEVKCSDNAAYVTSVVYDSASGLWKQAVAVCAENGDWEILRDNMYPFDWSMSNALRCGIAIEEDTRRPVAYSVSRKGMSINYFDFTTGLWSPWRKDTYLSLTDMNSATPSSSISSSSCSSSSFSFSLSSSSSSNSSDSNSSSSYSSSSFSSSDSSSSNSTSSSESTSLSSSSTDQASVWELLACSDDSLIGYDDYGDMPDSGFFWVCESSVLVKAKRGVETPGETPTTWNYLEQCGDTPTECADLTGPGASDNFGGTGDNSGAVGDTNWDQRGWSISKEASGIDAFISGDALQFNIAAGAGPSNVVVSNAISYAGDFDSEMSGVSINHPTGFHWILKKLTIGGSGYYIGWFDNVTTAGHYFEYPGGSAFVVSAAAATSYKLVRTGNTVQAFYGSTQIGTDKTVSGSLTEVLMYTVSENQALLASIDAFTLVDGSDDPIYIDPTGDACLIFSSSSSASNSSSSESMSSSSSDSNSFSSSSSDSNSLSSSSSLSTSLSSSSSGGAESGFTVTGAGTSDVNGFYAEDGTHDGVPYYTYQGTSLWYMYREADVWIIGDVLGDPVPNIFYGEINSGDTPPLGLWSDFVIEGSSPNATLS